MTGSVASVGLPPSDCGVDVEGVDFDPSADAASALGRDQGRAAAEKGIQNNPASIGAIEQYVDDELDRLYGRVQRELISLDSVTRERIGARIVPDVAAIAAVLAELDIVSMPPAAVFENENQCVLAPIEGAHAGAVLGPHADVFQFSISLAASREDLT